MEISLLRYLSRSIIMIASAYFFVVTNLFALIVSFPLNIINAYFFVITTFSDIKIGE